MTTHERPDLGPAAPDAARWATFRGEKIVVCLARTYTSAITGLDLMRIFDGDEQVKVLYTVCPGSKFERGAAELFRWHNVDTIPFDALPEARCHLFVTTSEKIDFTSLPKVPAIVVPHGVGFNKFVPDADSDADRLSGLVDNASLRGGNVTQMTTHPDLVRQLEEVTEHIVGRTELGGDFGFDLLRNSRIERGVYRRALGLAQGQHLVVFSSTWGSESLSGLETWEIERALAQLPIETFKVALVLHPNIWSFEGEGNVRRRLNRLVERSGLVLVDPRQGWHAVFVAASVVVGDNGSLSLYAAMNGTPLLIYAFSSKVVSRTTMEFLGATAPRLDPVRNLRDQIQDAIAGEGQIAPQLLVDRTISHPGQADELLRDLCYRKMGLAAPTDELPVRAAASPIVEQRSMRSFEVRTLVEVDASVTVERYPAATRQWCEPVTGRWERHLASHIDEIDLRVRQNAAVIADGKTCPPETVDNALRSMQNDYPGCRIAVVRDGQGFRAAVRGGSHYRLTSQDGTDPIVLASMLYALIVAGGQAVGVFTLKTGLHQDKVTITSSFRS